jgi:hypothetical protein
MHICFAYDKKKAWVYIILYSVHHSPNFINTHMYIIGILRSYPLKGPQTEKR